MRQSRDETHLIPIFYDESAFEGMRAASRLTAEILDRITPLIVPGVTTLELDQIVVNFAKEHGAYAAPLYYRGYPCSICTSINHVVCHGVPSSKPLKNGDVVNVDVTLILNGWHGDSSRMYYLGDVPQRAKRLVRVTYDCLMKGLDVIKPGATLGDVGAAIQQYAESQRCSVVRDFCGHGIGRRFHCEPSVMHYGVKGLGTRLEPGMFFTVEPMLNLGKPDVKVLSDGWTAVTRDRSLSAQFEHTIAVTEKGVEIFTLSLAGLHHPRFEP